LNKLLSESLENYVGKSYSPIQMKEQSRKEWMLKKGVSRQILVYLYSAITQ
jgi:hypothetical protein